MRMNPTWKEVVVYRHWRAVHVYNLVSHGRRMYRQLVFSSNHSLALQSMEPSFKHGRDVKVRCARVVVRVEVWLSVQCLRCLRVS